MRKEYNDEAFTVVGELEAYLLGVLYGDGCMPKRYASEGLNWQRRVSLKLKDREPVEFLGKCVGREGHVRRDRKGYWYMEIRNTGIVESLERLGLSTEKTLKQNVPQIEKSMYRHFLRGLLDSDGSVQKDLRVRLNVAGKEILEWLGKIFEEMGFGYSVRVSYRFIGGEGCLSTVSLRTAYGNSIRFLDWLYEDANYYMKRKHDLYLEVKSARNRGLLERDGTTETEREITLPKRVEELSYVLGIIWSSGYVEDGSEVLKVKCGRGRVVEKLAELLLGGQVSKVGKRSFVYSVESRGIIESLKGLGFQVRRRLPQLIPLVELDSIQFIKGYIDSNGSWSGKKLSLMQRGSLLQNWLEKVLAGLGIRVTSSSQEYKGTSNGKYHKVATWEADFDTVEKLFGSK